MPTDKNISIHINVANSPLLLPDMLLLKHQFKAKLQKKRIFFGKRRGKREN